MPKTKAPIIVEPERDTPGKIAAINWHIPIIIAEWNDISAIESILVFGFLFSIMMKISPTKIKAIATDKSL